MKVRLFLLALWVVTVVSHSTVICTDLSSDLRTCSGFARNLRNTYYKSGGFNAPRGSDAYLTTGPGLSSPPLTDSTYTESYSSDLPMARATPGKTMKVSWPSNNHASTNGGTSLAGMQLTIYKASGGSLSNLQQYTTMNYERNCQRRGGSFDQRLVSGAAPPGSGLCWDEITMPTQEGKHTFVWEWKWTSTSTYYGVWDVQVGANSAPAPAPAPAPSGGSGGSGGSGSGCTRPFAVKFCADLGFICSVIGGTETCTQSSTTSTNTGTTGTTTGTTCSQNGQQWCAQNVGTLCSRTNTGEVCTGQKTGGGGSAGGSSGCSQTITNWCQQNHQMSCAIINGAESCTTGGSTFFSAPGTAEVLIPVEAPPIPSTPLNGATKAHTAGLFGCLLYLVYFLF